MLDLDGSISEMHLLKIKSALDVEEEDDKDIDENISSYSEFISRNKRQPRIGWGLSHA
jgi:hypothetical protein